MCSWRVLYMPILDCFGWVDAVQWESWPEDAQASVEVLEEYDSRSRARAAFEALCAGDRTGSGPPWSYVAAWYEDGGNDGERARPDDLLMALAEIIELSALAIMTRLQEKGHDCKGIGAALAWATAEIMRPRGGIALGPALGGCKPTLVWDPPDPDRVIPEPELIDDYYDRAREPTAPGWWLALVSMAVILGYVAMRLVGIL